MVVTHNTFTLDDLQKIERLVVDEIKSIKKVNLFKADEYELLLEKVKKMKDGSNIDFDKFEFVKE